MASLHAAAPLYPISLGLVLHTGWREPRHRRIFDLQIEAIRACRGTAPQTAPEAAAAARARAQGNCSSLAPDHSAARYTLAVVNDERLWPYVNGLISWRDILLTADRELSGSRRVLLTLAASLCSLSFTFSLNDVVRQLDEADIEIAIHAMKIFRAITDR
jgi:hypothetical protein